MDTLLAYRRANGDIGIRNHVVILPLSAFSNRAAELIARAVPGSVALAHPHGRNEIGVARERLDRSLRGVALNGNVFGLVVVGYEPKTTDDFLADLTHAAKPIERVVVLDDGTTAAVAAGTAAAAKLMRDASRQRREAIPAGDLIVGLKCGGSDATSGIASNPAVGIVADRIRDAGGRLIFSETTEIMGAEHILARRARTPEVARKIVAAVEANEAEARAAGVDLLGINPVPDNVRGGITTIEEKSLGAILKAGSGEIEDVLGYGERPDRPGLFFMDSPSAAAEVMTGLSAAGSHVILFSTGNGNPVGNPISPVIKITSNPRTAERLPAHIDVDVSAMITDGLPLADAGDRIHAELGSVVSGALTAAEVLGHAEWAPIPVGL